jgi:2-isopropylmalate synthase
MKHKLRMTPQEVLESTEAMVAYAKRYCPDVEFSAEDAGRSDLEFLSQVCAAAIRAGATVINIPDTVGYLTPVEIAERLAYLNKHVENIDRIELSVHNHNDLGLATANSLAAVEAGATQIECTINGIGERAGNASLEEIVMGLHTRKAFFDAQCKIDTTQIYRACRLVSAVTGMPIPANKAVVGQNAFAHEAGIHQHGVLAERSTYEIMTAQSIGLPQYCIVLGKHSGKTR